MTPKVTVCVPAYNAETTIEETLQSILKQTFSDFEVIVIDNCSTDNTFALAKSIQDPRIQVLQNESNLGMAGNWNHCLAYAKREYFKLLCADDVIYPEYLEKHVKILDENPSVVLSASAREVVDSRGKVLMTRRYTNRSQVFSGLAVIKKAIRSGGNPLGEPSAVMLRSSVVPEVGEFVSDNPYALDLDYWVRVLLHGDFYAFREAMCSFLVHGGSASVSLAKTQTKHYMSFVETCLINPAFGITAGDVRMAALKTQLNSFLRKIFYLFFVR